MTCYLSLHRLGLLAAFLFVGSTSALHAQTNANSEVANSKLGPNTPQANRVLLQNSGAGHSIIPDPETILGHRLLHKVGTYNAAAQKANEIQSNSIGRISSSALNRGGASHRFFITDLGTLGGTESFAYAINDLGQVGRALVSGTRANASSSFLRENSYSIDLFYGREGPGDHRAFGTRL